MSIPSCTHALWNCSKKQTQPYTHKHTQSHSSDILLEHIGTARQPARATHILCYWERHINKHVYKYKHTQLHTNAKNTHTNTLHCHWYYHLPLLQTIWSPQMFPASIPKWPVWPIVQVHWKMHTSPKSCALLLILRSVQACHLQCLLVLCWSQRNGKNNRDNHECGNHLSFQWIDGISISLLS